MGALNSAMSRIAGQWTAAGFHTVRGAPVGYMPLLVCNSAAYWNACHVMEGSVPRSHVSPDAFQFLALAGRKGVVYDADAHVFHVACVRPSDLAGAPRVLVCPHCAALIQEGDTSPPTAVMNVNMRNASTSPTIAPLQTPVARPQADLAAAATAQKDWRCRAQNDGKDTPAEQVPADGVEVTEAETSTGCAQDNPLDTRARAPLTPHVCGGEPTAEQSCEREPPPATQDCELEAPAGAFAATWACLSKYEPADAKAKSLRGWQGAETPTWLHDLDEWWSLRRRPDAWSKAQEAEHNWLLTSVPPVADKRCTLDGHGPAVVADRLDLARKKAWRGASRTYQGWPSDLLDGLCVLERFTPGVTSQSGLTAPAHEAYRLCRQQLATAIGHAPNDIGQARNAAGGLPLPVQQRFMEDWNAYQRSNK